MMSIRVAAMAVLALGAGPWLARAQTDARAAEGLWQGSLQGVLRIVVHVERRSAGGLTGTVDSPDQGAMGLAIDTMAFAADTFRFEMRGLAADYLGRMNAAGDSIVGRWRQGGAVLPLILARVDRVSELRRPQEPRPPYPYDTVAVAYANPRAPGVRLAGTLTVPRGAGPFPGVLLITGSGPEDRNETVFGHRPFLVLADHLTRSGIAVLRVDDRGVGGSTGGVADATSEDFAGDALAGIEFLKTRGEIDPRAIGLVGHSEGGLIGPMAAAATRDVAFVVLMAGPGLPGDSILLLQSAAVQRSIGAGEESIARQLGVSRRMYAGLRQGDSAAVVEAARELVRLQIAGLPEAERRAVGDPDSVGAAATRQLFGAWMRFFTSYDPRPTLRRLTCPVLAITGEKDLQVPPKENLEAIRLALAEGGNRDATVKELPGLNHLFQSCRTCTLAEYAQLEETIAPVALEEISSWISARTRR